MDTSEAPRKRSSVRFGPGLTALLDAGHCAAPSLTQRLEVLASRYLALTSTLPTWSLDLWTSAIRAASRIDLTTPAAPWSLAGLVRQERIDTKLAYALESLPMPQTFAVLGIAERFIASGQPLTPEAIGLFLADAGVAVTANPNG